MSVQRMCILHMDFPMQYFHMFLSVHGEGVGYVFKDLTH